MNILTKALLLALIFPAISMAQALGYQLLPGDEITIKVFRHDNLSGDFDIDNTGKISLPLINEVHVSGLTTKQLEETIKDALEPEYINNAKVTVQLKAYRPIYVLGEVRAPGDYQFAPDMTVLEAIALAGGYTYRANEKTVDIIRKTTDRSNLNHRKFPIRLYPAW